MYALVCTIPVAKKVWRMFTMHTTNYMTIEDATDIAKNNLGEVIRQMAEWRSKHIRSFRYYPKYLKFFVLRHGCPRYEKSKKVLEFNVWLDDGEVEIMKRIIS